MATGAPTRLALRTALSALGALACSACAIDNHGLVLGRITHADGALVADLYSVGLHLKTGAGDAGVVLGYSRSSYVFARSPAQPQIAEGWYSFAVPLPAAVPNALHLESLGVSAHKSYGQLGMTLGYRAYTLMARASEDVGTSIRIKYRPSDPMATRLRVCEEVSKCSDLP